MKKNLIYYFLLVLCIKGNAQHTIIPEPVSYIQNNDHFYLTNEMNIIVSSNDEQVYQYVSIFQEYIEKAGIQITNNATSNKLLIDLFSNKKLELGNEGYLLEVKNTSILLSANESAGIFNGLQTLRQLFPADFESDDFQLKENVAIQTCKITDYPRFEWRGLMLDVSRHFFSVDDVKDYLDKMSQYKMNVFHWHLTDDEGWRIEIKSLPKLTEIGAWRVERHGRFLEGRPIPKEGEEATYGGFYTHEQIKDIVKYAQERNITIVPEIDIPGHSMALLAAYPELSVNKKQGFVNPGSKIAEWHEDNSFDMLFENALNPTDENVYQFIDKIFTEVAELFPGEYIHMGGDEAYHGFWNKNVAIKKFMKENSIKNSHELQKYFVKRVEKIIHSKGKKMIGWDEILDDNLAESTAIMNWRDLNTGIETAKSGRNVVLTPTEFAYLDYTQGDHSIENQIYKDLSLEKSYSFNPAPNDKGSKYILGGQANLWSEAMPTLSFAYYMTYPRAFAIVESLWTPNNNKDYSDFLRRTEKHFDRFDLSKTNISKAIYEPSITVYTKDGKLMCKLENDVFNSEIYYSVDNTYPVLYSIKYTKPFEIPEGNLNLRTQTYRNNKSLSRELRISREDLEKRLKTE